VATYRLQLRREFTFRDASAVVPYLRALGISELYLSPISFARPGSTHGYDVLDHARLNPELGDEEDLRVLMETTKDQGMGVVFDVVPNHMCILGETNLRWREVLEDGPLASSAAYFDIDWDPPKPELAAKILLPFLDDQYGKVLESGLSISFTDGGFAVSWGGGQLPLATETWVHIVQPALELLQIATDREAPAVLELESILRALTHTLAGLRRSGSELDRRHEKQAIRRRLVSLVAHNASVEAAITAAVARINGVRGVPESYAALERLMNDQVYRLAHWRVAAHEINYRRFFDINELAAVRVENPTVFAAVHVLPLSVANHPAFTGFRVDHLDGLADPMQYLDDLQVAWQTRLAKEDVGSQHPYVLVEKILEPGEALRSDFAADGTTGYDFMPLAAGLLLYGKGASRLLSLASEIAGPQSSFTEVASQSKHLVLESSLAAELTVLARRLDRISEQHRYTRDFTLNHLHAALAEVVASFAVYRTYVRERDADSDVALPDVRAIRQAVSRARRRSPLINISVFDFIESVLLRRDPPGLPAQQLDARREFVTRFQQLTGPVFAKGVEDTAFYRYLPLLALNEVGGDPSRWQIPDEELHAALADRARATPYTLSATATHDTKRGEDARARLYVLSEVADAWADAAKRWTRMNSGFKTVVDDEAAPDNSEEYLLYQTLVATWPMGGPTSEEGFAKRIADYMAKARHEAKLFTSYINPNLPYEGAAETFVTAVLDMEKNAAFFADVDAFVSTILTAGVCNSLAQLVLKIAAPGIPDFFQGREAWDLALVDPDNRRLVDFTTLPKMLEEILAGVNARGAGAVESWFLDPGDGRIKLWVTMAGLRLRQRRATLFQEGDYEPLTCDGPAGDHVFAFARRQGSQAALAILGRHLKAIGATALTGRLWRDTVIRVPTALASSTFRDSLTSASLRAQDGILPMDQVFHSMPVALLETLS